MALKYRGPAFLISGATHAGTRDLTEAVMRFLETGEAPAQGNLPLPVIVASRMAVEEKARRRRSAKKKKKAVPKKKRAKEEGRREEEGPPRKQAKRADALRRTKRQTKKPALAGFFVLRAFRRRSLVEGVRPFSTKWGQTPITSSP